jgi:hypothetical protein
MRKRDLLLGVVLIVIIFLILMSDQPMHGLKKYDCSIAEFSPDYPVQVKEACRRIRAEKRKE